jgi:hypothetical protein
MKAVFDALAEWRDEIGACTERHSEAVLDKMADAARALGWPKQLVDASHKHLVQASKAQTQVIDQLIAAWETQLKSPMPDRFFAQTSKFSPPGNDATSISSPIDFWMQAADLWQRNWVSAMSMWTNQRGSSPH